MKDEKSKVFRALIVPMGEGKKLYEELLIEKELLLSKDLSFIKEKFETKNPRFLKSISLNTFTPINILNQLVGISN